MIFEGVSIGLIYAQSASLLTHASYDKSKNTTEITELRGIQIRRDFDGHFLGNFVWVVKMRPNCQSRPGKMVTKHFHNPKLPGNGVPGPGCLM
jgi:hypothetical protein